MNETVLGERAGLGGRPGLDERVGATDEPRATPIISARSLLLRVLIAIVTVATLSIGGAWLMNAGIDPVAEASEGAHSAPPTPNGTATPAGR
jgi:hypothetical protein